MSYFNNSIYYKSIKSSNHYHVSLIALANWEACVLYKMTPHHKWKVTNKIWALFLVHLLRKTLLNEFVWTENSMISMISMTQLTT